jgi:O-antigen ligase
LLPATSARSVRQTSPLEKPSDAPIPRIIQDVPKLSGLGKLAFGSLCLLAFAIPWEDAITIPGFGTSLRAIGMVATVLGVLAIFENGRVRHPALGHFLLALFVLLAAVSYMWSLYPAGTLLQISTYVQLLVMVWLIWELAARSEQQIQLMQAYVLGTFVSGGDTIYQFLTHQQSVYQRYAGTNLNPNDLGLMMALSIPVSYYLLLKSRGKMVWLYRLQIAIAGTTVILTASRGATLATLVALAIVPLTFGSLSESQKVAAVLTLVLLISAVLLFAPQTSWERLATVPAEFARGTLNKRTQIWSAGWEIFREHPLLGIGTNAFRVIVSRVLVEPIGAEELSPAPPAHNTFLSVLVEQGVVGFVLFCTLLGWLAFSIGAMPPPLRQVWGVCSAVWVVGVSGLTWEMRKPTWFFFGLLMAQAASWQLRTGALRLTTEIVKVDRPASGPLAATNSIADAINP